MSGNSFLDDKQLVGPTTTTLLIECLKPKWQPNDVIRLYHEERQKIDKRGQDCKLLLDQTNSVLKQATTLRDLYSYISPVTSQLHSECKNIIEERNGLYEAFERINRTLSQKELLISKPEAQEESPCTIS